MSTLITMSINVSKLDKAQLFTSEKGEKFLNCSFYLKDEADQYGNHGMITQSISKELREAGERGAILGNAKMLVFEEREQKPKPKPAPSLDFDNLDDDLPF